MPLTQSEFFFFALIPTIMFDAGYTMEPIPFLKNFGAICMFAFLGTVIVAFAFAINM